MSIARPLDPFQDHVQESRDEQKARYIWGSVIVGLLVLQIMMSAFAVMLATGNPSMVVLPEYYDKAVQWDSSQQAVNAMETKGWHADFTVGPTEDIYDNRTISVRISDANLDAVDVESAALNLFHHAHADQIQKLQLQSVAPGFFQGKAPIKQEGLWEFRLNLFVEGQSFSTKKELTIRSGN